MKLNTAVLTPPIYTHEGGRASRVDAFNQLKRSVLTCLLWEDSFYEKGSEVAKRIAELIPQVQPEQVAALASEARDRMNLRHVPLYILSELSKVKGTGLLVTETLSHVIQRADELAEFVAIYWKDGKHPLSAGVKRGLASAFGKFNEYQLAKYNRDGAIKLRDVLFLTHAKPIDAAQADLWKRLVDGKLETPDTWEVALSAGADKKETFERLMRDGKLGGLAVLRNLRNMLQAGVDQSLIRERLAQGAARAFPYRFVVAAKHAPQIEDAIEAAMYKAIYGMDRLPGNTALLIDVSGSMDYRIGDHGESRTYLNLGLRAKVDETSRIDVACGLAILVREISDGGSIATFSDNVVMVPNRRGFALRDAIAGSQSHNGTALRGALASLKPHWENADRVIVITDEQSQDGVLDAWVRNSYIINVASNANGVGDDRGWRKINGWSEHVLDYIREVEALEAV